MGHVSGSLLLCMKIGLKLMVPEFYLLWFRRVFHNRTKFYMVSAAGQTPFQHYPCATSHAQSAFGILAETGQEGAICVGDLVPPNGNTL